jgi:heat shock protein HslJ
MTKFRTGLVCAALLAAGIGQAQTRPGSASPRLLQGTYWSATELGGQSTPAQDAGREPHLLLQGDGRMSGSDGCNKISGGYDLKGDAIAFGQTISTQMACPGTDEATERAFRDALMRATRWRMVADRLELLDATGKRLAAFVARPQASHPSGSSGLVGSSWQLVRFRGGDGASIAPDDGAKYTIDFAAGGGLTARIDCNRGRGTWKTGGSSQLRLGPLALTRAKCAEGSLHDQIVKQWSDVRTYAVKDGHLLLLLKAEGGLYEFEPVARSRS